MMDGMMRRGMGSPGMMSMFGIDGRPYDMERIDQTVRLGDMEVWKVSGDMMAHPFHVHGVHFKVLSRAGSRPSMGDQGLKDTVLVEEPVELLVHFTQPATGVPFVFHCHTLEHEDAGMMGNTRLPNATCQIKGVTRMHRLLAALSLVLLMFVGTSSWAETVVRAFGPGGPAPAMKEAADLFGKRSNVRVDVVAGPTNEWLGNAKSEADVIYSGSEVMMTDFVTAMAGQIAEETVTPLYLRPAAVLVRPGNPMNIRGFSDLFSRDLKVLVVNGAGQQGLWEDMAGRTGDIAKVKALRSKIVEFASNSAAARKTWIEHPDIDAWIIWTIWQVSNTSLADLVEVEPEYRIYRDTGIALTRRGQVNAAAKEFIAFLQSPEGAAIFRKWGWTAGTP